MPLYIKSKLTSDNVFLRIIFTYAIFLTMFFSITAISYYFLPQGFLRNKNPLQNWETSKNLIISTLQIFFYNMLSVTAILAANIFSQRKNKNHPFMPVGYTAFFVLIVINAVVLGTWSFSVLTDAVPLSGRFLRTFDLIHRAGLWEMSGQLFIACATAKISLVITDGKETTTRSWKAVKLSRRETGCAIIGLVFMLAGAFIESRAIIALS